MTAPRRWVLEFVDYPPGPNARMHWMTRARDTKRWRFNAALGARLQEIPALQKIRISAVIIRRAIGRSDEDNDRARLKSVVDGLVDAGVIPDDRRGVVSWGTVTEERGPRGLRLEIQEIGSP